MGVHAHRRARGRPRLAVPTAFWLGLAAVGLFAIWVTTTLGGDGATVQFDDVATALAAGLAATMCASAARRHHGGTRKFWFVLALALFAWTFGELAWGVYDLGFGGNVPVPSYADIGYLGAVPLTMLALLLHPSNHGGGGQRALAAIDAVILAVALLFLSWSLVLHRLLGTNDLTSGSGFVSIAYPFGDVLIIFLLIRALRVLQGPDRVAIAWILTGLLAMALSDSAYTYLTSVRGYETGNSIDIGWFAGYVFIAFGGWYGRRADVVNQREPSPATQTVTLLTPFLPLLLALGVLTTDEHLGVRIDDGSLVLAFVLIGAVLIRQLLTTLHFSGRFSRMYREQGRTT